METPVDRIRTLQQQRGLSQTDVAAAAQVKPSAVNQWMSGSTSPSLKALRALARHFRVRLDWLETGRGSMVEEAADLNAYGGDEAAVLDHARLELIRAAADAPKEAIDRARVALGLPPMDEPAHSGPIAPMDRRVRPGAIAPIGNSET